MIALIDGDVVVYRVGFASEKQDEAQNCYNTELVIEDILKSTEADSYKVFLSDSLINNFRYQIDPSYKANRAEMPRPKWYDSIRAFLMQQYGATITEGQEADDALGIHQVQIARYEKFPPYGATGTMLWPTGSIICSIDKDLLQIPGLHYNLSTGAITTVTPAEGLRHFYRQLLIGDRVDNITGVRGIGPVKAAQVIPDDLSDESTMFERVRGLYDSLERLERNGKLLWVRRREGEVWSLPRSVDSGHERDSGNQQETREIENSFEDIEAEFLNNLDKEDA